MESSSRRESSKRSVTSTMTTISSTPASQSKSSRSHSPILSPTKSGHIQQKHDLQHLNDRFAAYIDKVRSLETENSRLTVQISRSDEVHIKEVKNLKFMYDAELADARRLLDETAKEKARLQIEQGKWKTQAEELQAKLNKAEKSLGQSEKRALSLDKRLADVEARLKTSESERIHYEEEYTVFKKDLSTKEKMLETARKQIEEETILRVDLENQCQSLKEDLDFKEKMYKQELQEVRIQKEVQITQVDSQAKQTYDSKLQDHLKELRSHYEHQGKLLKQDMETVYDTQVRDMKLKSEKDSNSVASANSQLRKHLNSIDSLSAQILNCKAQISSQQMRIQELEAQLQRHQEASEADLAARDQEIAQLRAAMDDQLLEYQELMEVKLALDMEIAAYRKLLEGEESRLKISPSPPPARQGGRGTKRRRLEDTAASFSISQSASASGAVSITEVDVDGKFVRVQNSSDKDVALGGWQLKRQIGDEAVIAFKFSARSLLKAEAQVTIWSSNSGHAHSPPSDLVWKNHNWGTGDSIKTSLVDASGEVMATRDVLKEYLELSDSEGDPREKDKCCLM